MIYKFHYKYIGKIYDNSAKLLFRDTYSLVYKIKTNFYEDFFEDKNLLDFSDYSKDLIFFDRVCEKVIDKMKDEVKGKIISEVVGLKPKMYSLIVVDGEDIKKARSVKTMLLKVRHKE